MKDELAVYSSDVHPRQAIGSAIYIYCVHTHTNNNRSKRTHMKKREREREPEALQQPASRERMLLLLSEKA